MTRAHALVVAALVACGPSGGASRPPDAGHGAPDSASIAAPLADALVVAHGEGTSEDEAYAAATAALAAELLGDARWAEVAQVQVHARGEDPQRVERTADGIRVTLGLDRTRAATVISAFENAEPTVAGPAAWQETLGSYLRAHIGVQTCVRRRALFGSACETGETRDVDEALAELTAQVELVPSLTDGVPVDAKGVTQRPIAVYALWRGLPLAQIPVRVGDEVKWTDDRGRVFADPPADGPFQMRQVALDTTTLLGPRATAWRPPTVRLEPRSRDPHRWSLVVVAGDERDAVESGVATQLDARGFPAPVPLNAPQRDLVIAAPTRGRASKLPALAEALAGSVDLIVRVQYECAFAGRMGGNRVWWEAVATLTLYDAWNGTALATDEIRAKANGVSDERARHEARQRLAEKIAGHIAANPEITL